MRLPKLKWKNDSGTLQPSTEGNKAGQIQLESLVEIAISVWRLAKLCKRPQATAGKEDASATFLSEKIWHSFSEIGIEITDPASQPYVEGMSLNVLAFDYPQGETPKQRVIQETIGPAVFYRGEIVRMAQVIVGERKEDELNAKSND